VVPVDETLDLAAKVAGASPRTTPRRSTNDELQGFVKKTTKRRDSRTEWRVDAKEGIGVDEKTSSAYREFLESNGFRKSSPTVESFIKAGPQGDPDYRWEVANFIESDYAKAVITLVIIVNSVLIGVMTKADNDTAFDILEVFFHRVFHR